ncbi:MAG: hypothetical protein IKI84_10205 [Clostridia bacterium]|nr:hypothetical protein [Clostridia bacterium]
MKSVEDRLRELPQDAGLKRIEADEELRRRILKAASEKTTEKKQKTAFPVRWIAAAAAALVAGVGIFASVSLTRGPKAGDPMITSQSAGVGDALYAAGESASLDVHMGTVSISSTRDSGLRSVWASGSGANFPMVAVNGRYYRLLTVPAEAGGGLIGESIGTVSEFTKEPALSGAAVVSNICPEGTEIYAVSGMNGAVAAARVDGTMRLFQRVSFAGRALVGGESLSDTLRAGQVTSLELSGVGAVTGSEAKRLFSLLCGGAVYMNASCPESGQVLLISLSNGLTLQLSVSGETVSACGTWACPDFFEAFNGAL